MLSRDEHLANAEEPIEVTLSGITTLVRPEQPENAEEPIEVTLLGNCTLSSELHP